MKYPVEMISGGMIYIPSFRHSNVITGGYTDSMVIA
jgi:formylmethanofuran dehydrogenase subunit D